ncbi:MAG TPA: hypothetical protein PKD08_08540 [Gudongella oleilytica]|nr:hypothetical protein [Gudongella oleilytica]
MRLRNPKLAEYIFDLKLQEMTEYLSEHWTAEKYVDTVDRASFITLTGGDISKGGDLLLLDGEWVFVFRLPIDLDADEVKELLVSKMEETYNISN